MYLLKHHYISKRLGIYKISYGQTRFREIWVSMKTRFGRISHIAQGPWNLATVNKHNIKSESRFSLRRAKCVRGLYTYVGIYQLFSKTILIKMLHLSVFTFFSVWLSSYRLWAEYKICLKFLATCPSLSTAMNPMNPPPKLVSGFLQSQISFSEI